MAAARRTPLTSDEEGAIGESGERSRRKSADLGCEMRSESKPSCLIR